MKSLLSLAYIIFLYFPAGFLLLSFVKGQAFNFFISTICSAARALGVSRAPVWINFEETEVDLETSIVPGLLTSHQIPCTLVTMITGEESHLIGSCRH